MYYAAADGNRGSGNTRTVIDAIIARDPEELHALCFDDGVRIANHPQSQLLKILTALTTELDKKLDQEGRKAIAREQAASQSAQP